MAKAGVTEDIFVQLAPAVVLTLAAMWGARGAEGMRAARIWFVLRRLHWPGDRMRTARRLLAECRARLGVADLSMAQLRQAFVLLQRDGVLTWPDGRLEFPVPERPDLRALADRSDMGRKARINWDAPVRVSAAQLDLLARCRAPSRIATLLVCLARLDFDPAGEGRCALALIARIGGCSRRAAERALAELLADGVLERLPADPRRPEFWECGGRLRLGRLAAPRRPRTRRSVGGAGAGAGKVSGTHRGDEHLFRSPEHEHLRRAGARRDGRQGRGIAGGERPLAPGALPGWRRALALSGLEAADLRSPAALARAHREAAAAGRVDAGPAGLLEVAALAQKALREADRNPGGYLYALLEQRPGQRHPRGEDEDRARSLLREPTERTPPRGGPLGADLDALWAGFRRAV